MGVKIKRYAQTAQVETNPMFLGDSTQQQRETTVDGYTFHWAPNETRSFLDEGVGAAHAAFSPGTNVVEDALPNGTSRF